MTIKEKTIRELESLGHADIRLVYDLIKNLKRRPQVQRKNGKTYLEVREALKNIRGSLSEDIRRNRNDRV